MDRPLSPTNRACEISQGSLATSGNRTLAHHFTRANPPMEPKRMNHMSEPAKQAIDAISIVTVIGTIAAWLPAIAALFSIMWTAIRIYETRTVQRWLGRDK